MEDKVVKSALECPSCQMLSLGVDPDAEYVTCIHCKAVISVATGLAYFPKPDDAPAESQGKPEPRVSDDPPLESSTEPVDDGGDSDGGGDDLAVDDGGGEVESDVDNFLSGVV